MKTLDYLNDKLNDGYTKEQSLEVLKEELGIKSTINTEYNLVTLNYSQIDSPKTHPIVTECRSLVLDLGGTTFTVVSRSFDRFLNLGENGNEDKIDITEMKAYEKLDGSLIGLFFHKGEWLYRTKSMIMPAEDMHMDAFGNSWKKLIESLLEPFNFEVDNNNYSGCECSTFILELTSPYNRIVTRYEESGLYLLAIRHNKDGYYRFTDSDLEIFTDPFCWNTPKTYGFSTIDECKEVVENLPNLQEGYVLYDIYGIPVCKIKSPTYLAVHRIRGESIPTPKRIMDLVFTNETDEYLTYFPEDQGMFQPYINAFLSAELFFNLTWSNIEGIINQKEFALSLMGNPVMHLMFRKKQNNNLTFRDCFSNLTTQAKYNLVEKYLNEH